MKAYRFIISGGGTGGHLFPALSIAEGLMQLNPNHKIQFVGALGKIEMEKVPQHGFPIRGLWISGFQRGQWKRNLLFAIKLAWSLIHATWIVLLFRPHMAIGTGGYASGPLLFIAQIFGIKTFVQEQNSYPGITNRLLGKKADKIAVAYEGLDRFFPADRIVNAGNPIRKSLLELPKPDFNLYKELGLNAQKPVFLLLGGSLGAQKLNELMAKYTEEIVACGYQVYWQCGRIYYETYAPLESESILIRDFIPNMEAVYAVADVILSRAGAGTLSELSCVGKPTILIPSINVAENHQLKNAQAFVEHQAAVLIEESQADASFKEVVCGLLKDVEQQKRLAENIRKLAKPKATSSIIKHIETLLK